MEGKALEQLSLEWMWGGHKRRGRYSNMYSLSRLLNTHNKYFDHTNHWHVDQRYSTANRQFSVLFVIGTSPFLCQSCIHLMPFMERMLPGLPCSCILIKSKGGKPGNEVSFDIIYAFDHLLKDLEKDFVQNTKHFVSMGWSRHKISLVRSTSCAFLSLLYSSLYVFLVEHALVTDQLCSLVCDLRHVVMAVHDTS